MSSNEDKVQPKTYSSEDFTQAYQELCKKMGYRINVNPAFTARDDSTWSVVLQTSVTKLPQSQD